MGKHKRHGSLIAVPMGLEIYITSSDPELHTRIRGPQAEKIALFASFIETKANGVGGVYWADRAVLARDYLMDMSIPYLMLAGLMKAPANFNVFKLDYFRPVEVNSLAEGELYVWPVMGILTGVKELLKYGKDITIQLDKNDQEMLAKSLSIPEPLLTLMLPYIVERRKIPFLEEMAFKLSLEQALEDNDNVEILPVMPEEYYEGASWPRYLPLPPLMMQYDIPNRRINVPPGLDARICRRLENAGWVVNKQTGGGERKCRSSVKGT